MDYLSLCLICKDENDYLPEWLDYHILMGVDRFYIYDNDSQISLRESIKDYIERGWVIVVDIHGRAMQLYAYDHCLQTFGINTFWMGFIDTDEFLVPKTTLNLKDLLKDYESYGGMAVSSLFFGSSGHKTRPVEGQIAAYTWRTPAMYKEYEVVKCIVQPGLTLLPNSPHDFTYKETTWCVNEAFVRVDYQRFPSNTNKIQLNHYYCRSVGELDQKFSRGRGATVKPWARARFDLLNRLATENDECVIQNLELFFNQEAKKYTDLGDTFFSAGLLEKMAILAHRLRPTSIDMVCPDEAINFRTEILTRMDLQAQIQDATDRKDFDELKRLTLLRLKLIPQNIIYHIDLAVLYILLGDSSSAWHVLSQAWQRSPNNYAILGAMAGYFLSIENFSMAENTCHLLLNMAPHDMVVMGQLTNSLLGQGRFEEALKVGMPIVELSAEVGELPDGMGIYLVEKMADYLLEKKDYIGAVRLWEAGVKCRPGDVNTLIKLANCMLLAGDKRGAHQKLEQAQLLAPQDKALLARIRQLEFNMGRPKKRH